MTEVFTLMSKVPVTRKFALQRTYENNTNSELGSSVRSVSNPLFFSYDLATLYQFIRSASYPGFSFGREDVNIN